MRQREYKDARHAVASPPRRRHLSGAAFVFAILALYGSLVPLQYRPLPLEEAISRFRHVPYLQLGVTSRTDWVANILLFIPLGFLCLGGLAVDQRLSPFTFVKAALVAVCCALLSVALEFAQLWFPARTTSQNDMIALSIGATSGVLLWIVAGQRFVDWVRRYATHSQPKRQLDWLLEAYLIGFAIYQVLPLDVTISLDELSSKFREGRIILLPFGDIELDYKGFYRLFSDLVTAIPIGCLVSLWRVQPRQVRSWPSSLCAAGIIIVALKAVQVVVYSRSTSMTDIVVGMLGVGVGVALTRAVLRDRPSPSSTGASRHRWGTIVLWCALILACSAVLVVTFCSPFEFVTDKEQIRRNLKGFLIVPFARLYHSSEFNALTQVVRKMLFFAFLGGLLAAAANNLAPERNMRRVLLVCSWFMCLVLGTGIELFQALLVHHYADVTDVILYSTGGLLGIALTARFLRRSEVSSVTS